MKPIKHKFGAKPTTIDGIRFPSLKEGRYYKQLILRQKAGEVLFFLRQVRLELPAGLRYTVDFLEFWTDGSVHFIEVKGRKTKDYIMRKKLAEESYPITIEEI
jgi:hypothetical protein